MLQKDRATYSDLRTGETRAGIKTNTITTSATIHFDFAGIGLEVRSGIFGSHAALDSKAAL